MSEKHSAAPWRIEDGTTLIWGACNPDDTSTYGMGYPIAEARLTPSGQWATGPNADEAAANARLIAAAPDMLAALHLAGMSAGWQYMSMETRSIIEAVIARAEGTPQ